MHLLLILILTVPFLAEARLSELALEQLVPKIDGLTYEEALERLSAHEKKFLTRARDLSKKPLKDGFTQYTLRENRTPYVFILLPGLYRVPSQFRHIKKLIEPYKQNAIYLNLPGQGMDMYSAQEIVYGDWVKAVGEAAEAAKALGGKIIFIGQSTGGALSIRYTLDNPLDVAGLFLIEPAVKVRTLVSGFSCWTNGFIKSLNFIYQFAGRDDEAQDLPYMSTKVGCQVDKILASYLRENSQRRSRKKRAEEVFSAITVPTFILNNLSDKIVSTSHIRRFSQQIKGPVTYVEIPKKGASYHGNADFMFGVIQGHQSKVNEFMQTFSLAPQE